jgi:hypothetical protein
MSKEHDVSAIAHHFQIDGEFAGATTHGSGHINGSYRVTFHKGGRPMRYLLQRINPSIFKNPVALMENIQRVTSHLAAKVSGEPACNRRVLTLIPARDGRDPLKFPDLNHAIKRDPKTGMRNADNNWDFWSNLPEALHQVTIVMSDRGIPKSFRHMTGFGSHTYSFINLENKRFWVKFTFKTQQGIQNLTDAETGEIIARDREGNQRDLYESIERGEFPRWKLYVQIMNEEDANTYHIHPFDLTKVWPHADYPLIEVGEMELNRNAENFFADVEQAAFSPANIVPGISFSPDKMLQGRLFS